MILAGLLSAVLVLIAGLHALWGMGVWWPIRDEEVLARAVVGARQVSRMPGPIPCFLVVVALLVLAVSPWLPAGGLRSLIMWIAAIVFVGRGLLAYVPFWRRMTPEQPFAQNDRRYFGPLCLAVGLAFIVVKMGS
jgi:hypothetical protein